MLKVSFALPTDHGCGSFGPTSIYVSPEPAFQGPGHWPLESPTSDLPPLSPDSGPGVEGPACWSSLCGSCPQPPEHQPSICATQRGLLGDRKPTHSRHLAQVLAHRIMPLA